MAKIKNTKNELKSQRDALKRYQRYLPTLLLKKQQLQTQILNIERNIREKVAEDEAFKKELQTWIALFGSEYDFTRHLTISGIQEHTDSIAGVNVPVLDGIDFKEEPPHLIETSAWIDDGIRAMRKALKLKLEKQFIEKQLALVREELRTTNQRVNLFEKVKIPEAKEAIRVIRIALGDLQAAEVVRSKMAKSKGGST